MTPHDISSHTYEELDQVLCTLSLLARSTRDIQTRCSAESGVVSSLGVVSGTTGETDRHPSSTSVGLYVDEPDGGRSTGGVLMAKGLSRVEGGDDEPERGGSSTRPLLSPVHTNNFNSGGVRSNKTWGLKSTDAGEGVGASYDEGVVEQRTFNPAAERNSLLTEQQASFV